LNHSFLVISAVVLQEIQRSD